MSGPASYRDSTQIVLPSDALVDVREALESEFTVTVFCRDGYCRIIGSPLEIKAASDFLARHGVAVQ
jgi:hypothetical protein